MCVASKQLQERGTIDREPRPRAKPCPHPLEGTRCFLEPGGFMVPLPLASKSSWIFSVCEQVRFGACLRGEGGCLREPSQLHLFLRGFNFPTKLRNKGERSRKSDRFSHVWEMRRTRIHILSDVSQHYNTEEHGRSGLGAAAGGRSGLRRAYLDATSKFPGPLLAPLWPPGGSRFSACSGTSAGRPPLARSRMPPG